jgi:hypothetical protein
VASTHLTKIPPPMPPHRSATTPSPCRRWITLSVSYRVNSFPVSDFMSRRKPNIPRSCRTSTESSPTTLLPSLTGMSLCTSELRPPCRRASPVQVQSQDIARRVHHMSVMAMVKTCSLFPADKPPPSTLCVCHACSLTVLGCTEPCHGCAPDTSPWTSLVAVGLLQARPHDYLDQPTSMFQLRPGAGRFWPQAGPLCHIRPLMQNFFLKILFQFQNQFKYDLNFKKFISNSIFV